MINKYVDMFDYKHVNKQLLMTEVLRKAQISYCVTAISIVSQWPC